MDRPLCRVMRDTHKNIREIFDRLSDDQWNSSSKSEKVEKTHSFQLQNFWNNIRVPFTSLQVEVVKLSVVMAQQPLPSIKEIQDILATIEALALESVILSKTFPVTQGYLLQTQFKESIECIGWSLNDLLVSMQQSEDLPYQLQCTSHVINSCQRLMELPKDNLGIVLNIIEEEESDLVHTVDYLEAQIKHDKEAEEVDNDYTWSNQDREFILPCVGLVHTALATLKKLKKVLRKQANCDSVENIAQLDAIVGTAKLLNSAATRFTNVIYKPLEKDKVSASALDVVAAVRQTLELCQKSHWVSKTDESWLSFLLRAVDHNNNRVQPLLNPL